MSLTDGVKGKGKRMKRLTFPFPFVHHQAVTISFLFGGLEDERR
jgi:hypothetical protein